MEDFPSPGNGYTIRERLGAGNWKTAYRATSMHSAADVAILYFHDASMQQAFTGEVLAQLRAAKGHIFHDYIAEFKGLQNDEDGNWYIVEELLARPLDRLGIVNDIVRFVRIARDLCRGLTCLHDNKLVHRDIKLENCGLDHQERAKIFDLGLVTSDPQEVRGNIFTRAPELFLNEGLLKLRPKFSSDVWALGATLYALRFGEYPFVHKSEVDERHQINSKVRDGLIDQNEATKRKNIIRDNVAKRMKKKGAYERLCSVIRSQIGGSAGDILISMLNFDETVRPKAVHFADRWASLARDLGGASSKTTPNSDKWDDIQKNLNSVLKNEMAITAKQLERLAGEIRMERKKAPEKEKMEMRAVETLITKIKNREKAAMVVEK
jgi:serine/threonine protein kinase